MGILNNTKLRFRFKNLNVHNINLKWSCSGKGSASFIVGSWPLGTSLVRNCGGRAGRHGYL